MKKYGLKLILGLLFLAFCLMAAPGIHADTVETGEDKEQEFPPEAFTIHLLGEEYELPVAFAELAEHGWELDEADTVLDPFTHDLILARNGKNQAYLKIAPAGENPTPAEECYVMGVMLEARDYEALGLVLPYFELGFDSLEKDLFSSLDKAFYEYESEYGKSFQIGRASCRERV